MGNFLDTPKTEKTTEVGQGNQLFYGVSSMQGWRASMEDTHTAVIQLPKHLNTCSLFGVYDGHGGTMAAIFSAENILRILYDFVDLLDMTCPEKIGKALSNTFLRIDEEMRKLPIVGRGDDHSGCTAIVSFITPTHITVANTGDSRSVLAKNNEVTPMSFDHKPFNETEKTRIQKAGGAVRNKRVNGDLAVSRALGDFIYKNRCDLPAEEQQVSAEPDIQIEARDGTEEFLVIACDGIWDVMDNNEVCAFIRELMQKGETDMGLIAEELIDHCLGNGSRDNMSVVIVMFCGAKIGEGNGVRGIREERAETQRQRQLEAERAEQAREKDAPSNDSEAKQVESRDIMVVTDET